METKINTKEPW